MIEKLITIHCFPKRKNRYSCSNHTLTLLWIPANIYFMNIDPTIDESKKNNLLGCRATLGTTTTTSSQTAVSNTGTNRQHKQPVFQDCNFSLAVSCPHAVIRRVAISPVNSVFFILPSLYYLIHIISVIILFSYLLNFKRRFLRII